VSDAESPEKNWPRRRFWDKRRVGVVLALVGIIPTLIIGAVNSNTFYFNREEGVSGAFGALEAAKHTWEIGKYLFWFLPLGLVIHIAGIMETAKPTKRN